MDGGEANAIWFLMKRNQRNLILGEDSEEDQVNEDVDGLFHIVTDPGAKRGDGEPCLVRRAPKAYSLAQRFSRSLGLGRFIRAAQKVGGSIRLVHIGTRLAPEDCSTLRLCMDAGGHIASVDMSVEVPYPCEGLEVYSKLSASEEGRSAAARWCVEMMDLVVLWHACVVPTRHA